MNIEDVLNPDELALVKRTVTHFLMHPDYAEGDEQGITFQSLSFGSPLPLEIVLRDWCASHENGDGGRVYRQGDCHAIYVKLYESGQFGSDDLNNLIM